MVRRKEDEDVLLSRRHRKQTSDARPRGRDKAPRPSYQSPRILLTPPTSPDDSKTGPLSPLHVTVAVKQRKKVYRIETTNDDDDDDDDDEDTGEEDATMLSDLTENRTYKRFQAQSSARRDQQDAADLLRRDPPGYHRNHHHGSPLAQMREHFQKATTTKDTSSTNPPPTSFLARLLNNLDIACTPSAPHPATTCAGDGTDHQDSASLTADDPPAGNNINYKNRNNIDYHEWGVAPEEDDDVVPQETRGRGRAAYADEEDDEEEDDEDTGVLSRSKDEELAAAVYPMKKSTKNLDPPSSSLKESMMHMVEDFEVTLDELDLIHLRATEASIESVVRQQQQQQQQQQPQQPRGGFFKFRSTLVGGSKRDDSTLGIATRSSSVPGGRLTFPKLPMFGSNQSPVKARHATPRSSSTRRHRVTTTTATTTTTTTTRSMDPLQIIDPDDGTFKEATMPDPVLLSSKMPAVRKQKKTVVVDPTPQLWKEPDFLQDDDDSGTEIDIVKESVRLHTPAPEVLTAVLPTKRVAVVSPPEPEPHVPMDEPKEETEEEEEEEIDDNEEEEKEEKDDNDEEGEDEDHFEEDTIEVSYAPLQVKQKKVKKRTRRAKKLGGVFLSKVKSVRQSVTSSLSGQSFSQESNGIPAEVNFSLDDVLDDNDDDETFEDIDNEQAPDDEKNKLAAAPPPHSSKSRKEPANNKASTKEARLKQVMATIKGTRKHDAADGLPSIREQRASESTELKVCVPGTGNILRDNDLIGHECFEEEKGEQSATDEQTPPRSRPPVPKVASNDSADVKTVDHAELPPSGAGLSAPLRMFQRRSGEDGNDILPAGRKSSWKDKLGLNRTDSDAKRDEAKRMGQLRRSGGSNSSRKQKKKAQWKATVDPDSGRTYYYHRMSRKTTWSKPPDDEIYEPKHRSSAEEEEIKKRIVHEDGAAEEEKKDDAGEVVPEEKTARPTSSVWDTKKQIMNLLSSMAPPNGTSVDRLMSQYDGREGELLEHLEDMKETQPFDEPLGQDDGDGEPPALTQTDALSRRTRTATTTLSGFSGKTEKTQLIRNTRASKPDGVNSIQEFAPTTIEEEVHLPHATIQPAVGTRTRQIPSRIPVPRSRELYVEDLSVDRVKARTYDHNLARRNLQSNQRNAARPEQPKARLTKVVEARPSHGEVAEETDLSSRLTEPSFPNDSISALSENDEFGLPSQGKDLSQARRRALDEAITREDWDLAAALSEGMRTLKTKTHHQKRQPKEWTQSELDRYISENDWDAVANYIAHVRASDGKRAATAAPGSNKQLLEEYARERQRRSDASDSSSNPRKKFGARSQLQHTDLHSVSSWESYSSYESQYTSESYESEDEKRYRPKAHESKPPANRGRNARRDKEFAC